jgi:hypothetical protein
MDWQTNLKGVKTLFDTEDEETEAPDKAGGPSHKESSCNNGGGGDSGEKSVGGVSSQAKMAGTPPDGSQEQTAAAAAKPGAATEAANAAAAAAAVAEEAANLAERVRLSLEEQKAAAVALLRKKLQSKMLAYDAVLEARRGEMSTPHLLGGSAVAAPELGTMLSTGDGRMMKVHLEVNLGQRRTTTASFDGVSLRCLCNATHSGVGLGRLRAGGGGGERVAILLSDQAYPPAWPASGPSRCVAILHVENGTLHELAVELLRRVRGSIIEAGSIIMLFLAPCTVWHSGLLRGPGERDCDAQEGDGGTSVVYSDAALLQWGLPG